MSALLAGGVASALALALRAGAPAPPQEEVRPATASEDAPAAPVELRGVLRRAGDRAALSGVAVLIYPAPPGAALGEVRDPEAPAIDPPWLRRGESDDDGAFAIDDLPAGRLTIEIMTPGYARARWIVDVGARPARPLRIFLRADADAAYRTVVRERRRPVGPPAPVERHLSREEIRTLPGSQGDPLRALQSLPGVARAPFGLGLLVLRGAGPRQSQVFVGDHPVPQAFHLSGFATVLSGDAIADLNYVPSNFAPAYGNASGGLVVVTPRVGSRAGYHGDAYLDLGGVGAMAEGPVGRGSFLVAARRAHLDVPLRAYGALNELATTAYPSYYDAQAFYDLPLGPGKGLHVGFLGSSDHLSFKSPEDQDGERTTWLDTRQSFHRLDLAYRGRLGPTSFLLTPAIRYDTSSLSFGEEATPRRTLVSTMRAELQHRVSPGATLVLGTDAELARLQGDSAPVVTGAAQSGTTTQSHAFLGLYADARLRLGGLSVEVGSRVAAFVVGGINAFAADPRLRARLAIGERWSLTGGVGLYTQPIVPRAYLGQQLLGTIVNEGARIVLPAQITRNFDPTIAVVEQDLALLQAAHATLGAARTFPGEVVVEAAGFYRSLEDREDLGGGPETPRLVSFGGELIVRKHLTRRLYGWVAYTLLWAQRVRDQDGEVTRTPNPYDQRHNLVAVLSLRLPRNWQIGGRFRLASGLPYTPVVGALWQDGRYAPLNGEPLSGRFPLFHQLDVRVDKRWILRRTIVNAYLDLMNAYNAANTEAYIYSRDFSQRVGGLSLPILPLVGVRVDL